MKKLLILLLFIPVIGFSQSVTEINFEGFHLQYNFVLQNGNTLNIAAVDLDNSTAESDCQCTEYQFGQRLWVFETDHNLEIINERCFSIEDFQLILNENWVPAINNNVFPYNCNTPSIYDVFYQGDEIVFHLWEGSYGSNYTGYTSFSSPIGQSVLVKFNLEEFNFYDPIPYSVHLTGAGRFMVADKTFQLVTSPYGVVNMNLHYIADNPPSSNWTAQDNGIAINGYQNLHLQTLSGFSQFNVFLTEIFAGNSVEVILDYKQISSSIISFLVVANSLDGLYSEGVQYETSLFIIEVDFSDTNNLEYDVVKSQLEIPRDTDLRYEDYTVFVDNNNNFVFNTKQQQQSDFVFEDYNKLHFLNDDGSFESINLDNDFSLEWSSGVSEYSLNYETTLRYYHKILDIAFSEENFMTLEKVAIREWNSIYGETIEPNNVKIFKVYDYEGALLHRYLFSGSCGNNTFTNQLIEIADDITTIYNCPSGVPVSWSDTFFNIHGVNSFGSGYLVDTFANDPSCGTWVEGAYTFLKFTEMNLLSIDENERLDILIYPNPVLNDDFVTIQTSANGEKSVEVFDINGKSLITTTLNVEPLDISLLSSGIYLVNVTINGKSEISKLIIR